MPFNPFKKPEKPEWKKTGKERGATDWKQKKTATDWKKKHKGQSKRGIPTVQQNIKAENRDKLMGKLQPVLHPAETAKAAARAKVDQMTSWGRQTVRQATTYKAWGTCPKCLQPNKPRHRCQSLSISFMNPDEARAEYERLKKAYGIGPGKGKGRVRE